MTVMMLLLLMTFLIVVADDDDEDADDDEVLAIVVVGFRRFEEIASLTNCFSATVAIDPPPIQRKSEEDSCKLQWNVDGTFLNYTIKKIANGNPTELGTNSYYSYDQSTGVITLGIWNIQSSDSGTYLLTIYDGSSSYTNSTGTLFVYGKTTIELKRNPDLLYSELISNVITLSILASQMLQKLCYIELHCVKFAIRSIDIVTSFSFI